MIFDSNWKYGIWSKWNKFLYYFKSKRETLSLIFFLHLNCLPVSGKNANNESASALGPMLKPRKWRKLCYDSVLARDASYEPQGLNKPLLQRLLQGGTGHHEIAFLLGKLLKASSSLLRLNL